MLRAVRWASGVAAGASALLFLTLFSLAPLPARIAWPLATLVVGLAAASLLVLAWSILSLPTGAPWRQTGLRAAVALCGGALVLAFLLGPKTGPGAFLALLGGTMGIAAAWRPGWRVTNWSAMGAAFALPLAGAGMAPVLGGAALGLTGALLAMEQV